MRIAVITDIHANLPALEAALAAIRAEGCEAIYHTGDAIAIGPYPAECLDLLLATPGVRCLLGNHESYFAHGLPGPDEMGDGEVAHQRWTHARLDPQWRPVLAQWPYVLEQEFEGVRVAFAHYGLAAGGHGFAPMIRSAQAADLGRLFAALPADLILYGHDHADADVQGRARYVNPGSLGCSRRAVARYCVVELRHGRYTVEQRAAPYDDAGLWRAFEERAVPERQFIYRAFFGSRFGG